MLKTKINGVIAGVEQDLAINLMGPTDANRLGIIQAVINQAAQETRQRGPPRRPGQSDKRFYLLLCKPRNFVGCFAPADPGKSVKHGLHFFAPGTSTLQM